MNALNFFAELKRRNVYKVAVTYAVVAWLVIQVATQVLPIFEIPNWGIRLIVLLIVVGFPIALVTAWAFELTPEGIKRTEDVDPALEAQKKSHTWIYVASSPLCSRPDCFSWAASLPLRSRAGWQTYRQNRLPSCPSTI